MTGVLPLGTPIRHRYGRHRTGSDRSAPAKVSAHFNVPCDEIESVLLEDWNRSAARVFLGWLAAPAGGRWLDVGCGIGTLTQAILEYSAPIEVVGIDSSPHHIAGIETGVTDFRARFQLEALDRLRFSTGRFDAVASGLGLEAVSDPERVVSEQVRVARENGIVGAYVWDLDEGLHVMNAFWDAATTLDSAALTVGARQGCMPYRPERLAEMFKVAGLHHIEARGLPVPTPFHSTEDFWQQLNIGGSGHLVARGPAATYLQSLSHEQRERIRELFEHNLACLQDERNALTARIWAVKGIK